MDDVTCYLCGCKYQPTEEATAKHIRHAQGRSYIATPEQLARWLEACQNERDEALRLRAADV